MKEDALNYELKEGTLYYRDTGIQVVMDKDLFSQIVEAVHKDLGHYGKRTTLDGVAERYIVATDIWRDGQGQLDACVPCQLYKPTPAASTKRTATIHPYENKDAFNTWGIDWLGPLMETAQGPSISRHQRHMHGHIHSDQALQRWI